MAEKSYRIKTNIGSDKVVNATLSQDIDFLEILSLKINQEDAYRLHVSNYGIIVGRVLANEAFGIPNAKVSIFLKLSDDDKQNTEIEKLYPFTSIQTKDNNNKRYNLLPNSSSDDCYQIVGTFPNKRMVLDNDTVIEVYEKYWKYTTVTNQAGDYMIFGVPTGNQNIHVDVDLSDIGILSQKPRDFYYQGYNHDLFESSEQFKNSDNLDSLSQLLTQDTAVYVHPFFGEKEIEEIAITRCDVQVAYKFEPTCVFMGSIITERKGNSIGHSCAASRTIGNNENLITGEGTIEMIRKTPDGLVEEFPIKGNKLIDADGVWCYQIPMNLDYIGTDEFGNIIPVQDSKKGIPTRTSVRFRISKSVTEGEASKEHVAKYLVPNIHELNPTSITPQIMKGNTYNDCYEFGSATPKEFFRDLLWNKVYSVKNYIPRFQTSKKAKTRSYGGVRSVNKCETKNVFPYNNAFFRLRFPYVFLCLLMRIIVTIISKYNKLISKIICFCLKIKPVLDIDFWKFKFSLRFECVYPFEPLGQWIKCIGIEGQKFVDPESKIEYFPECDANCGSIRQCENAGCEINTDTEALMDTIQQTLAEEYDVVNFDFGNDWVNGTLYMPLWFWLKKAKKKYFFGLFTAKAKNKFCSCEKKYKDKERKKLRLREFCGISYNRDFSPYNINATSYEYLANKKNSSSTPFEELYGERDVIFGMIKEFTNRRNQNIYYYAPGVPYDESYATKTSPVDYTFLFATDIILLGSLNSCDLDNLPQAFNDLPSSTANVPFISTLNDDENGGITITGLDWGHDAEERDIKFDNGLLFDLTCWSVSTLYKSCVNLQRLCEVGIREDMDNIKEDTEEGVEIKHDGMITQKEIIDNNIRGIFASLNHNGLTNIRKNVTTNYDTYKFHYIYPTNFDGHLNKISQAYSSKYKLNDISDKNYVMYRLGEGKDSTNGRHVKHFYNFDEKNNLLSFPLYNNSYYFYFGLNEGKTAIDKFHTLFKSSCALKNKFNFTIETTVKPAKWCYNMNNIATDFATIDVEFNGLTPTFSYILYNEFNEILIQETDVTSEDLRFGYKIIENGGSYVVSSNEYKKDGRLQYFNTGEYVKNSFDEFVYLVNGVYYLEVENSNGVKNTQRINIQQNTLSPIMEEFSLGVKYKVGDKGENICDERDVYGELHVKSFIIDGIEVNITNVIPLFKDGDNENEKIYEVACQVECSDGSILYLILEPDGSESTPITEFICNAENGVPSIVEDIDDNGIITLIFNIWKPGDYILTTTQICNYVMSDNVSVNTFSIENGDNFQGFINGISLNVVSGSAFNTVESASTLSNNEVIIKDIPKAWLNLFNPSMYNFQDTISSGGSNFWDEIIDITIANGSRITDSGETITWKYVSETSKIAILQYQIETMKKMIDASYITSESSEENQFIFTTKGGKEPILIRNIHPNYAQFENSDKSTQIVIDDTNTVEAWNNEPNVKTYLVDKNGKFLNTNYVDYINQGNYFAAFTNNGGMVQSLNHCSYDSTIITDSIPKNVKKIVSYCPNSKYLLQTYPTEVYNINNPYFKTLFIEGKLQIFANKLWLPLNTTLPLDGKDDSYYGRLEGNIYGILPMIYDEDYNIIGSDLTYNIEYLNNNKWNSINTTNILGEDYSVRVNRKYNWNNNGFYNGDNKGQIYRLSVLSDNDETDLRNKMKVISNSTTTPMGGALQNADILYGGQKVVVSVSNNKLKGDLNYNIGFDAATQKETCTFTSHVIENSRLDFNFDNSNRINVKNGKFIFRCKNNITRNTTSLKWYYEKNKRFDITNEGMEYMDNKYYNYSTPNFEKVTSLTYEINGQTVSLTHSNLKDNEKLSTNNVNGVIEYNMFDESWYLYSGGTYFPISATKPTITFYTKNETSGTTYEITPGSSEDRTSKHVGGGNNNYHMIFLKEKEWSIGESKEIEVHESRVSLDNNMDRYLNVFSFNRVNEFVCSVNNDRQNQTFQNIKQYAPKLFVGYSEYFGFEKTLSSMTTTISFPNAQSVSASASLYQIGSEKLLQKNIKGGKDMQGTRVCVFDNIVASMVNKNQQYTCNYYYYKIDIEKIGNLDYCQGKVIKNNYLRNFHDSSSYSHLSTCNKPKYPFNNSLIVSDFTNSGLIGILDVMDMEQYKTKETYINSVVEKAVLNADDEIVYENTNEIKYQLTSNNQTHMPPSVIVAGITRQYGDNDEFTVYNHNSMWDTKDLVFNSPLIKGDSALFYLYYNGDNCNNDIVNGLINKSISVTNGEVKRERNGKDFITLICEDGYELIKHVEEEITFINENGQEVHKVAKDLNQYDYDAKLPHYVDLNNNDSSLLVYSTLKEWKSTRRIEIGVSGITSDSSFYDLQLTCKGVDYVFPFRIVTINGDKYLIGDNLVELVDLGLPSGKLWAKTVLTNINNEPLFFDWGDTKGWTTEQVQNGEKNFADDGSQYKWYDSNSKTYTKYNATDGKTVLDLEDDAAYRIGNYCIPSWDDAKELIENTYIDNSTINDGYIKIVSKSNSNNYIKWVQGGMWKNELGYDYCFHISEIFEEDYTKSRIVFWNKGWTDYDYYWSVSYQENYENNARYIGSYILPVYYKKN